MTISRTSRSCARRSENQSWTASASGRSVDSRRRSGSTTAAGALRASNWSRSHGFTTTSGSQLAGVVVVEEKLLVLLVGLLRKSSAYADDDVEVASRPGVFEPGVDGFGAEARQPALRLSVGSELSKEISCAHL